MITATRDQEEVILKLARRVKMGRAQIMTLAWWTDSRHTMTGEGVIAYLETLEKS